MMEQKELIEWASVKVKIKDLVPHAKNPKKWKKGSQRQLDDSLERFGVAGGFRINADGTLLDGHGRCERLVEAGYGECEITVSQAPRQLTEEEQAELLVRFGVHNRVFDFEGLEDGLFEGLDLEGVGLDLGSVPNWKPKTADPVDDEYDGKMPTAGVSVLGDVWELVSIEKGLRHRVMCGDSTDADQVGLLFGGQLMDLYFTDPPYGVSYADKNRYLNAISPGNRIQIPINNDHMGPEEMGALWLAVFSLWKQKFNKKNSFYICSAQGFDLMMMMMMMMMMDKAGIPYRHTLVWVKNNHVLGRTDYNYQHEPILYGWVGTHTFYGNGKHKTSVWNINKPHKSKLHPTMKPVELVGNAIQNSTEEGMVVGDSFLGSGTTLIACEQLGRNCYGMKLDEKYADVIVRRWCMYMEKEGSEYKVLLNGKKADKYLKKLMDES